MALGTYQQFKATPPLFYSRNTFNSHFAICSFSLLQFNCAIHEDTRELTLYRVRFVQVGFVSSRAVPRKHSSLASTPAQQCRHLLKVAVLPNPDGAEMTTYFSAFALYHQHLL